MKYKEIAYLSHILRAANALLIENVIEMRFIFRNSPISSEQTCPDERTAPSSKVDLLAI